MASKKSNKAYFGLGRVLSLILAIIPVTAWILGVATRFTRGNVLGGVLNIFLGFPFFWLIDLVTMITSKDVTVLA